MKIIAHVIDTDLFNLLIPTSILKKEKVIIDFNNNTLVFKSLKIEVPIYTTPINNNESILSIAIYNNLFRNQRS